MRPTREVGEAKETTLPELSIILPTYNEAANLPALARGLDAALVGLDWEAIVIDDDSPDGTAAAVEALGARDARWRCLRRVGRRGLASACLDGMSVAGGVWLAVMDADLQHDERLLSAMLAKAKAQSLDLVVASRYLPGGSASGFSLWRGFISRCGTWLCRMLLPSARVSDPSSGFFLLSRSLYRELAPNLLGGRGYKLLLDMLASAERPLAIGELAYRFRARESGVSKFDLRIVAEFIALLAKKRRLRSRGSTHDLRR